MLTSLPDVTACERWAELFPNGAPIHVTLVLVTFDITAMFGYSAVSSVAIDNIFSIYKNSPLVKIITVSKASDSENHSLSQPRGV